MKRIFSAILSLIMVLSLVAAMGINASAKDGDLLYTVNFKGDDKFAPAKFACLKGEDVITAVPSDDGSSVTATYSADADAGRAFWGGAIKGLTYGEGKQYTITMKMAIAYTETDGKLSSGNAGVFINMLNTTDSQYIMDQGYKALVGYYGCPNIRHTMSYGAGGKSIGAFLSKDAYITDAKYLLSHDADGFYDMTFAVDGKNVKVYINNVYLDEYDAFNDGLLEKAENVGFVIYLYNKSASITVKDAKVYEGITVKNATYPDYYVEGAKVTNYETSKTGDLLFTADFTRKDSGFNARFVASNDTLYTATIDSANPGHITIENVGGKAGTTYYAGVIGGLEVNSETRYTYDVKIKTSAQNAGFGFAVPNLYPFGNSIALYGNFQTGSIATQHGANKILNQARELASNGYAAVSNMAVDADGFASLRAELHGYEFTAYYLNTEGNWELYTKVDMTHTTKNDGSAEYIHDTGFDLAVCLTLNNKGLVAEYKDINVYKGLLITDPEGKLDPVVTEPTPADPVPTGDSALIFAVVAAISVLGVAVVAKRREN
ncbi:MAG: hypothetical protein II319_08465 [Clostridia bacterium]|nr:hypothetical protein [Clostridia bacterium]